MQQINSFQFTAKQLNILIHQKKIGKAARFFFMTSRLAHFSLLWRHKRVFGFCATTAGLLWSRHLQLAVCEGLELSTHYLCTVTSQRGSCDVTMVISVCRSLACRQLRICKKNRELFRWFLIFLFMCFYKNVIKRKLWNLLTTVKYRCHHVSQTTDIVCSSMTC